VKPFTVVEGGKRLCLRKKCHETALLDTILMMLLTIWFFISFYFSLGTATLVLYNHAKAVEI
jgi:hypothetical protein